MRKKIGILTTEVANKSRPQKVKTIGVELAYYEFAAQFGDVRIITADQDPKEVDIDLLILPGGPDFSVALQSMRIEKVKTGEFVKDHFVIRHTAESPVLQAGQNGDNPLYTYFYRHSFVKWLNARVPMFGICMGFQGMASLFGADLKANMPEHQISDNGLHELEISPFWKSSFNDVKVNSRHHQAIPACSLPAQLDCIATCDGWVEALLHRSLPLAAVQWHPEDLWNVDGSRGDIISLTLIDSLLHGKQEAKRNALKGAYLLND
jgi:gamma-glutamyl-gamma-aminobutyrate hydrolase PuuD